MAKAVKVIQRQNADETPTEVIADAIIAISEGLKRLRSGRLNDRALVMLIQAAAPKLKSRPNMAGVAPSTKAVKSVLEGIESLAATYIRKPTPKSQS